jgi:hypothetical protein
MPFDFQKLGLDRLSTNIAKTVGAGLGSVVTGDITRGEVVEVTLGTSATARSATGSATVKTRRVGAELLGMDYVDGADDFTEFKWSISDETLTVETRETIFGTFSFWVF